MRIRLRKTTLNDIDFVFRLEKDENNKNFVGQWTKDQHINSLRNEDIYHLVIEHSEDRTPLGYIILAGITNPNKSIEFMRIVISDKGKGYGREAVRLIKKLTFEELKAHRLWLDVKDFNKPAQRLYESEDFIFEARLRDCIRVNDHYESLIVMSMLESEYVNV